jgi:hypothetical protein
VVNRKSKKVETGTQLVVPAHLANTSCVPVSTSLWFLALCLSLVVGGVTWFCIDKGTITATKKIDVPAAGPSRSARNAQSKEARDPKDGAIDTPPNGPKTVQPQAAAEERAAAKRADARVRMRRDKELYTRQQLREIDALYQVVEREWRTEAARKSLQTLVEKYPKANRTGCALLSLGRMRHDEERIAYLQQAIADHSDCCYGDGVQVGAYARFLLGRVYFERTDLDKAKTLFDEVRSNYTDAVDHEGRSLLTQLPSGERASIDIAGSNPMTRRSRVPLAIGLGVAVFLVGVVLGLLGRRFTLGQMADPSGMAHSYVPAWQEVASKVYCPGLRATAVVGLVFALVGVGFVTIGAEKIPGMPLWFLITFTAVFALFGGALLAGAVSRILSPVYVRHAAPDVLPNVSQGPVVQEGSLVHGRLTHELWEDTQGWQFRPAARLWRSDRGGVLGFGISFMVLFAGLGAWAFHSQLNGASWLVSAVLGAVVTAVCGGTAFAAIYFLQRASYRELSRLSIPRNGDDIELDSPEEPDWKKANLAEAVGWMFLGGTKRHRSTIPRELAVAVQLCPWKFALAGPRGRDITRAVQGLLVLASPQEATHHRVPLLLTCDFVGAARLMQRLANILNVPYLFCADAEGWKAEEIRAKKRPPLQVGGVVT